MAASAAYDALARRAAAELKVGEHLGGFAPEALADAMTFEEVEKAILREWRDRVLKQGAEIRLADLREADAASPRWPLGKHGPPGGGGECLPRGL